MRKPIIIFISIVFLAAAAPIALNGGAGAPFDGGTIDTQLLAPSGTSADPSYSHSAETGLGIYRSAADVLATIVDTNLSALFVHYSTSAVVQWATNLTYTSSDPANPAVIATDADTGIIAQSRAMDFVWNGDAFASIRTSGAGSYYGGFCLDASNTVPCITTYLVSSGKFILTAMNSGAWGGVIDLGDDGSIKTSTSGYYFDPDNVTVFSSTADTQFSLVTYNGTTAAPAVTASTTLIGAGHTTRFLTLSTVAGAPPAGDCDVDDERGRLVLDTTNSRLYVCGGATRLWDYYTLVDDGAI